MSFKVITFNLNGQVRFGWEERRELTSLAVAECGGDLLGFQEFGLLNWPAIRGDSPNLELYSGLPGGDIFMNPIAWRRERFVMENSGTEWLSENKDFERAWGGSERAMSWVELRDIVSDQSLLHVNLHLDNISELARVKGTKQVISFISTYPEEHPVVITGDFNCSPYSPTSDAPYTREPYDLLIHSGFRDSRVESSIENFAVAPFTFHNYQGGNYNADIYATWHTDWIMIRNLNAKEYRIHSDPIDGRFPSDHYPVSSVLEYV